MKAFMILMALMSNVVAAASIEVNIPKGAKEAYALEMVADICSGTFAEHSFEQMAEMKALSDHYEEQRKQLGLPRDYELGKSAALELYNIKHTIDGVSYAKCAQILTVTGK